MWQFKRLQLYKMYVHVMKYCGKETADQEAEENGWPTRRPAAPLYTSLLYLLPLRIQTKVLDEAQKLKRWDGKQRAAVQAIITTYTDILTGTPCGNVWTDILSMCGLLPHEPFHTKQQFFNVFAPTSSNAPSKAPNAVEFNNLIRYLLPFTFGRTIDQLDLKGVKHEDPTTFRIAEGRSERTLWLIESFVRLARMSKEELAVDEKDLQSAMGFCTRAEQESGFPVLADYTEKQKAAMQTRPMDLRNARNMFVEAVRAAKLKAMELEEEDTNEAKSLPGWAEIDETDTQSARFSQKMITWLMETGFEKLALLAMTGSGSANSEAHDQVDMADVADDDAAEFIEEIEEEQEKKEEQAEIAPCTQEKKTGKTKKKTKHQMFLDRVAKMSDRDVFTPRCNKLLELYDYILVKHPDEKIIIWSRFYKALIIIAEAFRRRHSVDIPVYSGVLSTKERDDLLHRWQTVSHATTPIGFQAKAGGTGLTINEASQVIFVEVSGFHTILILRIC